MTEAVPSKAPEPKLLWQEAKIAAIMPETPRVKSFLLAPSAPFLFRAGQHVDVRLTAPDGYQAERSYSIASAPEADGGESSSRSKGSTTARSRPSSMTSRRSATPSSCAGRSADISSGT